MRLMERKERSMDALMREFKFLRGVFIVAYLIRIVVEQQHLRQENTKQTLNLVAPSVLSLYVKIVGNWGMICIKITTL